MWKRWRAEQHKKACAKARSAPTDATQQRTIDPTHCQEPPPYADAVVEHEYEWMRVAKRQRSDATRTPPLAIRRSFELTNLEIIALEWD